MAIAETAIVFDFQTQARAELTWLLVRVAFSVFAVLISFLMKEGKGLFWIAAAANLGFALYEFSAAQNSKAQLRADISNGALATVTGPLHVLDDTRFAIGERAFVFVTDSNSRAFRHSPQWVRERLNNRCITARHNQQGEIVWMAHSTECRSDATPTD
jgi:hypothetical protein